MNFDPVQFETRYRLASFGEAGGVLLDTATGALSRLNATACRMVVALRDGEALDAVAAEIAARTSGGGGADTEVSRIRADAHALAATLQAPPPPPHESASRGTLAAHVALVTEPAAQCVTLHVHDVAHLRWWPAVHSVARMHSCKTRSQLTYALRLLAPHIATHYHHDHAAPLHGSALAIKHHHHGTAIAWLGASGAGKSTLATQAQAAGLGTVLADDILPLQRTPEREVHVVRDGEAMWRHWCEKFAAVLVEARAEAARALPPLPTASDDAAATLQLQTVALLAADQRHAEGPPHLIKREPIKPPEALLEVLRHTFAELGTPEARANAFTTAAQVARSTTTTVERWYVPNELPTLPAALTAALNPDAPES